MNRKAVFLLAFLLVLYILPLNLTASYESPGIADRPNLVKDFTTAAGTYDFVDAVSDLHSPADIGTHNVFADLQDYGANLDTLTESASSGGASLDVEYNENLAETSLASVTWTNRATITIAPPSGTKNYLVIGMCEIKASTAGYRAMARIQKADTTTMTQVEYFPQDTSDYVSFFSVFYESVTNPSTLLIDLDYACSSASETMYIRDARLISVELTSAATEDEDLTRVSKTGTSYSDVSTITVSAGSYLLFSAMVFDGSSTTYSSYVRLYDDTGAATLQEDLIEMVSSGSAARHSFAAIRYVSPTGSNTYSNEYRSENSANTAGCGYSHIIAVPVACFGNYYYNSATGSSTPAAQNTWETKVSNSYSSLAADHLIIGTGQYRAASGSYSASERLYYNGGTTDNDAMREDKDTADWYSHCMFTRVTLSAGSHEDRIQMWMETGATSSDFQQAWLFSLELRTVITPCELDLEIGWTAADYDETNEILCIFANTTDAENIKVDVWAGSWVNVLADLVANQWNNVSVASYLDDSSFEMRFLGGTETGDTTQSTWDIDAVLLYTWSPVLSTVNISQSLTLSASTNTAESLAILITEALAVSENVTSVMTLAVSILQIIAIVGTIATQRLAEIVILQNIAVGSVVSTAISTGIRINELLILTSSTVAQIVVGIQYSITINEMIGVSTGITTAFGTAILIYAGIGFFDSFEIVINPPIELFIYAVLPIGISTTVEGGLEGLNIFYDLFFSLNMWSYLGPMGLVLIGYYLTKKDKLLGVFWFILECLFVYEYFTLVTATPLYWWHIFILIFGGLFTCVYPMWDNR